MRPLTARRYDVRPRRRPDPMSISSPHDFVYRGGGNIAADAVIDDPRVSLYCLDPRRSEAVFVETPASVNLADHPFYYQVQYEQAQRAIVMPLAEFHATAAAKGDRFERAIMVHSVGRCGSTLLSKMFGSLHECLSLSEPDVPTQLMTERFDEAQLVPLLRSTARHYFQPSQPATHLVMKFRSFCIELAAAMHAATPGCASLFLYRDIERVIVSGMRAFRYPGSPLDRFDRMRNSTWGFPLLTAMLAWHRSLSTRLFPASARFTTREIARMGPVGFLAMAWVSAMECCVRLQREGVPILALRYDHLIAHPESTVAELLQYCGLSASLAPQMLAPLGEDSQAGSVLERGKRQNYELSLRDRETIRDVLSRSDIIDSGDFEVPGTIGSAAA